MSRYNDRDLFKKLKTQKPIVKRIEEEKRRKNRGKKTDFSPDLRVPKKEKKHDRRTELKRRESKKSEKPAEPALITEKFRRSKKEPVVEESKTAPQKETSKPAEPRYRRQPAARPIAVPPPEESYAGADTVIGKAAKSTGKVYRHELKYYINYRDYYVLRNAFRGLLHTDRNANDDGRYHIRSLYFDDSDNSALREKIDGVNKRKKYRVRIYNYSDSFIRLEKKIKKGEYIHKEGLVLSRPEYESIVNDDYTFLAGKDRPVAQDMFLEMKLNRLRPVTVVDYEREAFVHPMKDVRITFDKNIQSGMYLGDIFNRHMTTLPALEQGMMVMEVKFQRYLPDYIRGILNTANAATRSAVSKYAMCRKFD